MAISTNGTVSEAFDMVMMSLAIAEARKCQYKPTSFSVGCVLLVRNHIDGTPVILATGFSRELEENTHAEANALEKARRLTKEELLERVASASSSGPDATNDEDIPSIDALLRAGEMYTTMEPCSVRTSGLAPCADALIKAGISRCVIGVGEPDDFVHCEGAKKLITAGVQVEWLKGMEQECLEVARAGHHTEA